MKPFDKLLTLFLSLWLTSGVIVFSSLNACAQEEASVDGARGVLLQFAGLSKQKSLRTEEARKILTGEFNNLKTDSFGKLSDAPDKVLLIDKTHAVGRFQFTNDDGRAEDLYFYLRYENGWKIYALRALALPKFMNDLYAYLKTKPDLSVEEKSDLANMKLLFSSDAELKNWFAENRAALEKLIAAVQSKKTKAEFHESAKGSGSPEAAALQKLNLSSLSAGTNGDMEFLIGGIVDNSVGFLYSPSKKPPEISTLEYIWVEEIAPGWYLYRTT